MSFRRTRVEQPVVLRRSSSLTRPSYTPKSPSYALNYGSSATTSPSSRNLNGTGTYFDYSNLIGASRRDSYGANSTYKSPYKDKDRYSLGSSNTKSSYTSPYKDRYISPYTNYENGVTTAGLSIPFNKSNYRNSLISSSNMSGSTSSLNTYSPNSSTVSRSQSLRDHERKSRSRSRASSIAANTASISRSVSNASVTSEGYESGTDKSRSRVGSEQPQHEKQESRISSDAKENGGDYIDYKALYEAAKADNDKLKTSLRKKDEEIGNLKGAIDRFTNATTKNSLSELEKRERRAMERKISEMEEEVKQLQKYKSENERLRAENRALTRVVSKLTTSAQNQLSQQTVTK